ncbi:unnamed protein product, partial [Tetraodon nigroviridis]
DTQRALQAVERLQARLKERGEVPTEEKLSLLRSVLQSPLFHQILALQKSVQHLRDQVNTGHTHILSLLQSSSHLSTGYSIPLQPANAVKPNGGHVPPCSDATAGNGNAPSGEFEHAIHSMAQGRYVTHVELEKPESGGLGFSVVGLKSENHGELGIFIQEIQPGSVAHCDGKLREADQILAINGQPLDKKVTHQQAIAILQNASDRVGLTVARGPIPQLSSPAVSRTPSAASTLSAASGALLHLETIELVNDGTGLGFGIVGGKTSGVIVKTILPGGIADQDGRLRSGDHILRIGDTDLLGMGSEQVAQVLRQCGNRVKLVVTRGPADEGSSGSAVMPVVLPTVSEQQVKHHRFSPRGHRSCQSLPGIHSSSQGYEEEEEDAFDVSLTKNAQGLGITIAGYVGDKNSGDDRDRADKGPESLLRLLTVFSFSLESSGIFVKSVTKDSAVDHDGRIHVGDQIIAVDGVNIQGYTNQQAVEVLRHTGQTVHLRLIRRGFRPEEIPPAVTPSVAILPPYATIPTPAAAIREPEQDRKKDPANDETPRQTKSEGSDVSPATDQLTEDKHDTCLAVKGTKLTDLAEEELMKKWQEILGPSNEVVVSSFPGNYLSVAEKEVAQVEKFSESSGLGVSLEASSGHHYIRSVLPEGPVGRCGKLFSGDELLELTDLSFCSQVNGISLIGETHKEVVRILKELPVCVYMSCCRPAPHTQADTAPVQPQPEAPVCKVTLLFHPAASVSFTLQKKTEAAEDPAAEDGVAEEAIGSPLAMWESEVQSIELEKGEGGLGFSILDYQDPLDPAKTVIVIRSLVPGGVAERDGRLLPGDRLMYVNSTDLESASLEDAVQALKGAKLGRVQIGVAKPLPVLTHHGLSVCLSVCMYMCHKAPTFDATSWPLPQIDTSETELSEEKTTECSYSQMDDDTFQASMTALHGSVCSADLDYLNSSTPKVARLDLVHEHPRLAALSGLAENAASSDSFAPAGLRGSVQSFTAALSGLGRYLPQEVSTEEPGGVLASRAVVPDKPAEPLRYHMETPKIFGDIKMATKGTEMSAKEPAEDSDKEEPASGSSFERTITVVKGNSSLGMTVSTAKDGLGMVIRSVIQGGSISRDGRLGVGDLILAINGEPTANLSNAQARAMLRRHSLVGPDMGITYVPAEYLEEYKASLERTAEDVFSETRWVLHRGLFDRRRPENGFSKRVSFLKILGGRDVPILPEREDGEGEESASYSNWNQPRRVELFRESGKSLGISIVGGRGMGSRLNNGEVMRGIFIKHILEDSPAGQNGTLKTGDRIVEVGFQVGGVDLRDASHEEAVEAIRKAGNPVSFLVQSIIHRPRSCPAESGEDRAAATAEDRDKDGASPSRLYLRLSPTNPFTPTPFKALSPLSEPLTIRFFPNLGRGRRRTVKRPRPFPPAPASSCLWCPMWERLTRTRSQRFLADPLRQRRRRRRRRRKMSSDTAGSVIRRYGNLPGVLHMIELEKGKTGLGLSLAGNRDRSRMSVFVVANRPRRGGGQGRTDVGRETNCSEVGPRASAHLEGRRPLCSPFRRSFRLTGRSCTAAVTRTPPPSSRAPSQRNTEALEQMAVGPVREEEEEEEKEEEEEAQSRSSTPSALSCDPATCPIIPGCETTIDISKGRTGLGLSIVGGCDTLLGAIIIHEVYEEGAASKDGRLWAGDQILEVNAVDLREASHDQAINVLRQTPQRVRLVVYRDEAQYKEEELWDSFSVELQRRCGQGLGLSIVGRRNDTGVFVSDIVKGGPADADGRLTQGDQILSVNGEDVRSATQEATAALLKRCVGPIRLEVGRFKAGPFHSERRLSESSQVRNAGGEEKLLFQGKLRAPESPDVRTVEFTKGPHDSLGVSIAGGVGSPLGDIPIFIAMMNPVGIAAQTQKLKIGDRIVSICGSSTDGMTHSQAVALLKNATGTVQLQVVAGGDSTVTGPPQDQAAGALAGSCIFQDELGPPQYKSITLGRGPDGRGLQHRGRVRQPPRRPAHLRQDRVRKGRRRRGRTAEEGRPDHGSERAEPGRRYARGGRGHSEEDQRNRHAHRAVVGRRLR